MASSFNAAMTRPKELPPVNVDDDLPPPPPSPPQPMGGPSPDPPPKNTRGRQGPLPAAEDDQFSPRPPNLREVFSSSSFLTPPGSPSISPGSSAMLGPPSPNSLLESASRSRKVNPFVDLLETEKIYVDTLSGIIRKVAAAWSRSNLPPPELDMMFRSVEAIFKANRSFYSKLKEIGPNPSSPRAIGDLLMKWIDQLDAPYSKYCTSYLTGFDSWEPVQNNQRLSPILENFSTSTTPPNGATWTIDALLSLPRNRIKYYLKLYGRLLKSSGSGKSTDQKLMEGVGKLESLLTTVDGRSQVSLPGPTQTLETTDEVVIDTRETTEDARNDGLENDDKYASLGKNTLRRPEERDVRTSVESSTRGSSLSSGQRSSRDTAMTSEGRSSFTTLPPSMADLERRLSTERCQDLFTMTPRTVRLSLNTSNLSYTRELRLSENTAIYFTPKSTNVEVVHRQGHIILLTDLFLVCERMSLDDRAHCLSETADMWLCYPPLAAKHLKVAPLEDNGVEVTILKREIIRFYFDSRTKRDGVLREFKLTSEQAAALPPPSRQPPPPLPTSNILTTSEPAPPARQPSDPPNSSSFPSRSGNASPREASPATRDLSMQRMDPGRHLSNDASPIRSGPATHPSSTPESGPPPYSPTPEPPRRPPQLASPPGPRPIDQHSFTSGQIVPPPRGQSSRGDMPPHDANPVGLPPRPNMREGPPAGPTSFAPGQIIPPQRSGSGQAPPQMGGMPPTRGPMSPPPMNGMNGPPRGMKSPPPMQGMNGGPAQMGSIVVPQRNGSMHAPQPHMAGPGPSMIFPGPGPMQGQRGPPPGPNYQQQLPPHPAPPFANQGRPSSDPSYQGGLRKTPSLHSLSSQHEYYQHSPRSAPPVPNVPNAFLPQRENSFGGPGVGGQGQLQPMLPSAALPRIASSGPAGGLDYSPPTSPTEQIPKGPVHSSVLLTMKCKVFLQQQHAQWKALGSSNLTLYEQRPTMVKQLVVEADNREKTMLISTIVLTDGVERVGKTGIAIELSDNGARTGIVYMIQLRNEKFAGKLYEMILSGSDRGGFRG